MASQASDARRKASRRIFAAAAPCLVVLSAVLLFVPIPTPTGQAIGWITQQWKTGGESDTRILINRDPAVSRDAPKGPPPVDQIQVSPVPIQTEEWTLEQASTQTQFVLLVPRYVPEGYAFKRAVGRREPGQKSYEVELEYSGRNTLVIRETLMDSASRVAHGFDADETQVKEVDINGEPGYLVPLRGGGIWVVWYKGNVQLMIHGFLTEAEIMRVALSL